jgi:pimeloyl-ACP methyl ester carboxylesterase
MAPMAEGTGAPAERWVPGDGVRLHARDWGGDGPAVVLLHGLASNCRIWDGVAPLLAAAGLRTVALDQRGHGESEQPDHGYDFATVGRDLQAVVAALGLDRPPLLVGHSWGGNVALQYAADRDDSAVAGLALVDGGFIEVAAWPGMTREKAREQLAPPRFAVPLDAWLSQAGRWMPPGVGSDHGWVREFLRAGVEVDAAGVARARFHFDNHMHVVEALYEQRPSALYARVGCPVLLLPAGSDEFAALKRPAVDLAAQRLPHARVVWFDDTMHDIPLQRPEALAAELARFAAELPTPG